MHCPNLAELPPPPGKTDWPWTQESPPLPETMFNGHPWPKISVITPVYNSQQFLEETIRSVLLQKYANLEYIIIDGGSTDGTVGIIRKYERWLAYWVSEPDRGQSHAINKGISQATGDIIFWLNADDICLPGAFRVVAEVFSHPSQPRLIIGQAWIINAESQKVNELHSHYTTWEDYATRQYTIRQVSAFFHGQLFNELGKLDESLHYSMDRDLLLRLTRRYPPRVIEHYVTAFRSHGGGKFDSHPMQGYQESDRVAMRYLRGTPWVRTYRRWSAKHWLELAKQSNSWWTYAICLWKAMVQHPGVFARYFRRLLAQRKG